MIGHMTLILTSDWSPDLTILTSDWFPDQGQYHYLSILCWLLCSALGRVPPQAREEVRHTVTRIELPTNPRED